VLNSAGTGQTVVSQGVLNAIAAHGNHLDSGISYAGITIFTNGADTRTRGAELTATYSSDFDDFGHVDWSAGFNYNQTSITKLYALPAIDKNASFGQTALLTRNAVSALTVSTPREKLVLGAYYTNGPWSINIREDIYGPSSQWVSLDSTGSGPGATDVKIGVTGITDLDIGYKITEDLKLDLGANNLFDTRPPSIPNINNKGTLQPADGNNVYGEPAGFSPFGINGGYYYGRITYSF
jgi:iron complex outermembrane receptor protein